MQYQPYEERPEGQWVLFFCKAYPPQCWTARLFPTWDRALSHYNDEKRSLYTSPEELAHKWGTLDLIDAFETFNSRLSCKTSLVGPAEGPHAERPLEINSRIEAAQLLWDLLQRVCDRVFRIQGVIENDDDEHFTIRLDRMTTPEGLEMIGKFNKQKRLVCEELIRLNKGRVLESELKTMMREAVTYSRIKTKQDPWRIFAYYAPELGDCGFVYYPGKRHKLEDHAQNA